MTSKKSYFAWPNPPTAKFINYPKFKTPIQLQIKLHWYSMGGLAYWKEEYFQYKEITPNQWEGEERTLKISRNLGQLCKKLERRPVTLRLKKKKRKPVSEKDQSPNNREKHGKRKTVGGDHRNELSFLGMSLAETLLHHSFMKYLECSI